MLCAWVLLLLVAFVVSCLSLLLLLTSLLLAIGVVFFMSSLGQECEFTIPINLKTVLKAKLRKTARKQ